MVVPELLPRDAGQPRSGFPPDIFNGNNSRSNTEVTLPEFSQSSQAEAQSYPSYYYAPQQPRSTGDFQDIPGFPRASRQQMFSFSEWRSGYDSRPDAVQVQHSSGPTCTDSFRIPFGESARVQENTTASSRLSEMHPPDSIYGFVTSKAPPSLVAQETFCCSYKDCLRIFGSSEDLQEHEAEHVQPNECKTCRREFQYPKDLRRHTATHERTSQRLPCDICHKTFPRLDHLQRHLRNAHNLLSNDERWRCQKKRYTCPECKESFAIYYDLDLHLKSLGHKKWICHECETFWADSIELDRHAQSTSHKAYKCKESGCEATWNNNLQLYLHKMNDHPHECDRPGCSFKSLRKDALQRHIQTVHAQDTEHSGKPGKTFPCKYCRRHRGTNAFKRRDHLAQHLTGYHHFLLCSGFCSLAWRKTEYVFKEKSEYLEHRREVHGGLGYDCGFLGCNRKGMNGFHTEAGKRNHRWRDHWGLK